MTLGPALLLLAAAEGARGRLAAWLVTLGRVPMLSYVAHLFLVHLLAVAYAKIAYGDAGWLFGGLPHRSKPAQYGLALPGVYLVWMAVVLALTPLCWWFARLKQRRTDWWLSYLWVDPGANAESHDPLPSTTRGHSPGRSRTSGSWTGDGLPRRRSMAAT